MIFHQGEADFFVPDGHDEEEALARVTHLGIGAHHDDLEFMAFHGIATCYASEEKWFAGVTCTDGAGSPRVGRYGHLSDAEMRMLRREEQRSAARVGRYAAMLQLDHPSRAVKSVDSEALVADIETILLAACPDVVYTHNPADKHDTHVAVVRAVIEAIRRIPAERRPIQVLGCEVWRGLDWMNDAEKIVLDVSGWDSLAAALHAEFGSQIAGGKRYDLATLGRRSANATFFQQHAPDAATQVCFAMDLTPLACEPALDPVEFACGFIDRFREDVRARLSQMRSLPNCSPTFL